MAHAESKGEDLHTSGSANIHVSLVSNPTVFMNLGRKYLRTTEQVTLSALEGAIVTAVDAAFLLERAKIAAIISVNTSYTTVTSKRLGRQVYRARIQIVMKKTEQYEQFLVENPDDAEEEA